MAELSNLALLLCLICSLIGNCLQFRLHAQALTLAALAGAAAVEYYDHRNRTEPDPYAKFLPVNGYSRKE
ncbi:hypothetical protein V6N13_088109 [Hibiscus sabdariffa]